MPRPKRLNIPGVPQHTVQRGNNRQRCFIDHYDYRLYLELLKRASTKHECQVHAYVLMGNHVHLLLTPEIEDGVSLLFRDLGRDYVRLFNRRHERTGTLWEGRFKSSLVDSDRYLLACYRYIELNPVRAQLVKEPSNYRWSSFRSNGLGETDRLLTPHKTWVALSQDEHERRLRYLNLFDTTLSSDLMYQIRTGLLKGMPFGSRKFVRKVEKTLSVDLSVKKPGRQKKPVTRKSGPDTHYKYVSGPDF